MNQNNSMTQQIQKPKFSVAITTSGYQKLINNTLQNPARAGRFIASITSAVAVNPALQDCDAGSILASGLLGESLNLQPSPQLGQFYLVPFKSKAKYDKKGGLLEEECTKAQFVLGYKGYIQLALRSGYYADLDSIEIKEGEYLGKDSTTGKPRFQFIEDDDERDSLPAMGYMAFFEYLNGFKKVLYWSKSKMLKHADQYSSAFSASVYDKLLKNEIPDKDLWRYSSFWYKSFDDMAKKTLLRQLISKWGVMSIDMQNAFENDGSVREIDNNHSFISTPEERLELTQPEAVEVVEKIDLADLQ